MALVCIERDMTRILHRALIFSLTTAIGVTTVGWVDCFERREESKIQDLSFTLLSAPIRDDEDPQFTMIADSLRIGEFYTVGHACGDGFVTGYITFGRKRLSHSFEAHDSVGEAQSGFIRELGKASVVIEGPDIVIRDGKPATRYLIRREEDADTFFEIIWREKHDMGFTAIAGPDEDNTRRLETYVLRQN